MAKQVTDRQGATNTVVSAADTHAARLAEKFAAMFGPFLQAKEKMPDIALVVKLVSRYQQHKIDSLVAKSDAHDRELADDAEPRERRDGAADALGSEIIEIRDTLQSTFGPAIVGELGLAGQTDREPKAILAKSKRVLTDLKNAKRKWPNPRRRGVKIQPAEWVEDLEPHIVTLEKALGDVARETREAQATGEAKAQAMQENDDAFSRVATFLSALFRLVGDYVLARKVRPSARRPGQILTEEEDPGPVDEGEPKNNGN
jgi:hypothetical protein